MLSKLAGRAYHLLALPSGRVRVSSAWINAAISGPQVVELGLIDARSATIEGEGNIDHEREKGTVAGKHDA